MSSPNSLLIVLVVVIQLSTVVATYLLFKGKIDDKSRLWLIGIFLMATGISLTALRPVLPAFWTHPVVWFVVLCSVHLLLEVIRRELGESKKTWFISSLIIVSYFVYGQVIYRLGLSESLGYVTQSMLMAIYCPILLIKIFRLHQKKSSKGLIVLLFGMALYTVPSVMRFVYFLLTYSSASINVHSMNPVMNIVSGLIVIAIVFVSLGYWLFRFEKFELEDDLALEKQQFENKDSDAMKKLVQQRDQLLEMNSRLSVIDTLSSFSAMIIHDIAQPLQTLQLGLERIRVRLSKHSDDKETVDDLKQLECSSERAGMMIYSLRKLIKNRQSQPEGVKIKRLFDEIYDLLQHEAFKKIKIKLDTQLLPQMQVLAEPVMLQRVLVNVVANSINHLQIYDVLEPEITIKIVPQMHGDASGVAISIEDNGKGFPEFLLENFGQPWSSDKSDGLGMALMLSKELVRIWGGHLKVANRIDGVSGALVTIWLKKTG